MKLYNKLFLLLIIMQLGVISNAQNLRTSVKTLEMMPDFYIYSGLGIKYDIYNHPYTSYGGTLHNNFDLTSYTDLDLGGKYLIKNNWIFDIEFTKTLRIGSYGDNVIKISKLVEKKPSVFDTRLSRKIFGGIANKEIDDEYTERFYWSFNGRLGFKSCNDIYSTSFSYEDDNWDFPNQNIKTKSYYIGLDILFRTNKLTASFSNNEFVNIENKGFDTYFYFDYYFGGSTDDNTSYIIKRRDQNGETFTYNTSPKDDLWPFKNKNTGYRVGMKLFVNSTESTNVVYGIEYGNNPVIITHEESFSRSYVKFNMSFMLPINLN